MATSVHPTGETIFKALNDNLQRSDVLRFADETLASMCFAVARVRVAVEQSVIHQCRDAPRTPVQTSGVQGILQTRYSRMIDRSFSVSNHASTCSSKPFANVTGVRVPTCSVQLAPVQARESVMLLA